MIPQLRLSENNTASWEQGGGKRVKAPWLHVRTPLFQHQVFKRCTLCESSEVFTNLSNENSLEETKPLNNLVSLHLLFKKPYIKRQYHLATKNKINKKAIPRLLEITFGTFRAGGNFHRIFKDWEWLKMFFLQQNLFLGSNIPECYRLLRQ